MALEVRRGVLKKIFSPQKEAAFSKNCCIFSSKSPQTLKITPPEKLNGEYQPKT
jgi:hypothetical protein